jgi:hypothetical protein
MNDSLGKENSCSWRSLKKFPNTILDLIRNPVHAAWEYRLNWNLYVMLCTTAGLTHWMGLSGPIFLHLKVFGVGLETVMCKMTEIRLLVICLVLMMIWRNTSFESGEMGKYIDSIYEARYSPQACEIDSRPLPVSLLALILPSVAKIHRKDKQLTQWVK